MAKLLDRLMGKQARGPQVRHWGTTPPREAEVAPLPELREERVDHPDLRDLSKRDYLAILIRAAKEAKDDRIPDVAAAVAYYAFLSIPSALLVTVGTFSLGGSREAVDTVLEKLGTIAPEEAVGLVEESLRRVVENDRGGLFMILVGVGVALWTVTGAMSALIRALNVAYDRDEGRGFLRQRLTALAMFVLVLIAVALVFVLLVLGPVVSDWVGSLLGLEEIFKWIWWTAQWPILVLGLLFVFAGLLYLGPNVDHPRWRFLTPGSVVAVVLWLLASGAFAIYVSMFGSYNKTWGTLAAVIIMLTWLWLSSIALLFGAEINAESERTRELRRGETDARKKIQAPRRT